jgi:hypothetical protein
MQYVSEREFVDLLNAELRKSPHGVYLPSFTLGDQGFNWPWSYAKTDLVYLHVYGIYH